MNCYYIKPGHFVYDTLSDDIDTRLEQMYEFIDCRSIDVISIKVKGQLLDIWLDDEGMYNNKTTLYTEFIDYPEPVVGNLIITGGPDENGNTTSAPTGLELKDFIKKLALIRIGD